MNVEDAKAWQRVGNIYICVRDRHPAFGYIIERRSDGRWLVRCPDGSMLLNTRGSASTFPHARAAAMNATSNGYVTRYDQTPRPPRRAP
jgi:hypothetical protein